MAGGIGGERGKAGGGLRHETAYGEVRKRESEVMMANQRDIVRCGSGKQNDVAVGDEEKLMIKHGVSGAEWREGRGGAVEMLKRERRDSRSPCTKLTLRLVSRSVPGLHWPLHRTNKKQQTTSS